MDTEIQNIINQDFDIEVREAVMLELLSLELKHVMAESEHNLRNARMAILYLAKGSLSIVKEMTHFAKIDFRDVILWASEERKKNSL